MMRPRTERRDWTSWGSRPVSRTVFKTAWAPLVGAGWFDSIPPPPGPVGQFWLAHIARHCRRHLEVDSKSIAVIFSRTMKAKNQQGLRSLLPLLVATLLFGPSSKAFASDQDACTSMLQNAYGKYYGCTLKLYSKASKKGETVASLQRCRDKLDKLVTRALIRYGQACPDLTSSDLSDFADQCVADTADVSAGTLSPDAVATVSYTHLRAHET